MPVLSSKAICHNVLRLAGILMTSKPTKILFAFFFAFFIFKIFLFSAFAQSPKQNFNRIRTFDVQHYTIRTSFDRKNKMVFGDTTILLKPLARRF